MKTANMAENLSFQGAYQTETQEEYGEEESQFFIENDSTPLLNGKKKNHNYSAQNCYAPFAMLEAEEGYFRRLLGANIHATAVYFLVFWSFGMCVGFLGPTLWDLGCQTGTVLPTMTWVFFSQTLFILIGSMLGGLAIETFSPNPVLLVSMLGIVITLGAIPFAYSMPTLTFILAVMGFNMGLVDTTANVSMLSLYKIDVSPFLQALHFFYGLGAFLSPLIAQPYVTNFDCTKLIDNRTINGSWIERAEEQEFSDDKALQKLMPKTLQEAQKRINIQDAFWVMTVLQIPVILSICLLIYRERNKTEGGSEGQSNEETYENLDKIDHRLPTSTSTFFHCCINNSTNFICIVVFSSVILFFADGLQADFGDFVYSYGKIVVRSITAKEAALLNACFWGTFATGRLIAIFAALWFSPGLLLLCDVIGSLFGVFLLLIFPESHVMLYVATGTIGLFLSSVYPSTIALSEQFVDIGPSSTSFIVVGAATGEMLYPVIVGHLFDKYGPSAFLATAAVTASCMIATFFLLVVAGLYAMRDKNVHQFLWMFLPCCCKQDESPTELKPISHSRSPTKYET